MRFVRAFTHPQTGEITHVRASDLPFADDEPNIQERSPSGDDLKFDRHDVGVAEDFTPTHPATGAPCPASRHLIERLEHMVSAPASARGADRFRAKAGHQLPVFHNIPTTLSGIRAHLRANGLGSVHERVAHWLEFHDVLTGDEMDAHGLPRLTIARAAEFDVLWITRHPSAGSRLEIFKRKVRERAALRAARRKGR